MNEKYHIGLFGHFEFTIKYKNKYGVHERGYSGCFEIIEVDDKNVLLADPDIQVLVTKKRIKKFDPMQKPELI